MKTTLLILLMTLILVAFLAPLASSLPDGLEATVQKLGFGHEAPRTQLVESPLPDYSIPSMGKTFLSRSLAGILGTLVCFLLPFSLYILRKK